MRWIGRLAESLAAKSPTINADEQEDRLKNAKLSRPPTPANSKVDANLAGIPPAYIGILQHGNMSLESAEEVEQKDDGESSSAPHHTSTEPPTNMGQSEVEKADHGALDDPSSLVYRLSHR